MEVPERRVKKPVSQSVSQSKRPSSPARVRSFRKRLAAASLVVFDFDGVMTDNRVLTLQDGTEGVFCDRSDGLGIGMLKKAGVPMLVLSKEPNPVVAARCRKLQLECEQGIDDKVARLDAILRERGLTWTSVIYVGNDVNDVPCMSRVGLAIAVADAYPPALKVAKLVTTRPGGRGAVREVCDWLLAAGAGKP